MVSVIKGAATGLTLFGFHGSSTTNRIRIALAVKKIPYTFQVVDAAANEQRTELYHKTMNALEQVPILKVEGQNVLLRQSVAIMEYLEDAYPETQKLLPDDPLQRARIREVVEIVNSFIQPMQNKLTVEKIAEMDKELAEWLPKVFKLHIEGGLHDPSEKAPILWPQEWIIKGLESIEGLIDDGSTFCFGNNLTLADCALVPQVIGAKKYLVDMTPYPKATKVHDNVMALDVVKEGMADVLNKL
jgi:maleylacetoacetate isomerase